MPKQAFISPYKKDGDELSVANKFELRFGVSGGGSISGESGKEILRDIQNITKQIESSGTTKLKFTIDTSVINKHKKTIDSATKYWQGRFQESVKALTAPNVDLKPLHNYYRESERLRQRDIKSEEKKLIAENRLKSKYYKNQNRLEDFHTKHKSKIKSVGLETEFQVVQSKLKNKDFGMGTTSAAQIEKSVDGYIRKARDAGIATDKLSDKLRNLFRHHLSTAVAMVGVHLIQQSLTQLYDNVVALDKAVVNLQIATGGTREETKALVKQYSNFAQELGATTVQVTEAANDWLRQGYSIADSNKLIKDSMMLSKLGQMESAEATTALTSAMKGYGITVNDATSIVDKFSSIDMRAAVSAGYIATAMSKTAASAKLAGISIDKLSGYIAVVGETTQDEAESVGTFFKTMVARIGNVKAGRLVDPETQESLSDVENVLNGVGIKLRDSNDNFRNFGDVLDEVAGKWGSYSNVQQHAIATAISGTRQQEKFNVLMQGYSKATEYATVATNSAGSALDKYNNSYLKGVEAAQDRAKASFEKLSNAIMNSDLIKNGFNIGSEILNILSDIISLGDGIIVKVGALIGAIAVFKSFNIASIFSNAKVAVAGFMAALANPISLATITSIGLITAAVSALGYGMYYIATYQERLAEATDEAVSKYEESKSKLENVNSELVTTKTRIAELQAKLAQGNITLVEQMELEKLQTINQQLKEEYEWRKKNADIAQKLAEQAAVKEYQNKTYSFAGGGFSYQLNPSGTLSQDRANLNIYNEQLSGIKSKYKNANSQKEIDKLDKQAQKVQKNVDETETSILSLISDLTEMRGALGDSFDNLQSDDAKKSWREITHLINQCKDALGILSKTDKFESIISNESLKSEIDIIKQWANTLNKEALEKIIKASPDLKVALKEAGISVKDFARYLEESATSAKDSTTTVATSFSDLEVNISSATKKLKDISNTISKVSAGENLSGDEVIELLNTYPKLASAITGTANGYKIEASALKAVREEEIKKLEVSLQSTEQALRGELVSCGYLTSAYDQQTASIETLMTAGIAYLTQQLNIKNATVESAKASLFAAEVMYGLANLQSTLGNTSYSEKQLSDMQTRISQLKNLKSLLENFSTYMSDKTKVNILSNSKNYSSTNVATNDKKNALDTGKDRFSQELNELKHAKAMGVITERQYLDKLEVLYKNYYDVLGQDAYQYMEEVYEGRKKLVEDAKSALEELHETIENLIKQEKENEKDAYDEKIKQLEKEYDAYQKIIDLRKNSLKDEQENNDYLKNSTEKKKNVSDLQSEYEKSKLDNSAEGKKKQLELEQKLAEAKTDLSEYENAQAYKRLEDQIDKEQKAKEEQVDKEKSIYQQKIDELSKYLDDATQISNDAWNRMNGMNSSLYQSLIDYNMKYGDGISENIIQKWNQATSALQAYGSTVQAYQTYLNLNNSVNNSSPIPYVGGSNYNSSSNASYDSNVSGNSSSIGAVSIGGHVRAGTGAKIYKGINGKAYGQYYKNDPRYTVLGVSGDWVKVRQANLSSGVTGWFKISDLTAYKRGTPNVPKDGMYLTNEPNNGGSEAILTSKGIITPLHKNDAVLNPKQTKLLYEFLSNPDDNWLSNKISSKFNNMFKVQPPTNTINSNESVEVNFYGGINLNGNTDKSAVENFKQDIVNKVLKAVNQDRNRKGYTLNPSKAY